MFTGHTLKVIIGFCGMILLGLLSLLFVDSLDQKNQKENNATVSNQESAVSVVLPPIKK